MMLIATKIQHDQAKLLRWKLNRWLSSATKAAFTRIINSHTEEAELTNDVDIERLNGFVEEWNRLGAITEEIEIEDEPQPMYDGNGHPVMPNTQEPDTNER